MKEDKDWSSVIFISLLPFVSVLAIVMMGVFKDTDIIDMMKINGIAFLLTTAMVFYIHMKEEILKIRFSRSIISIAYLGSILLVILPNKPEVYSFWIIGGLLVAMIVDVKLGFLVYFNLCFIMSLAQSLGPEAIVHFLVLGVLCVLLSSSLKKKETVIYAAIILLSSNITLSFILNNFIFDSNINVNYLASFFSIFAVLVTAFLLYLLYLKMVSKYYDDLEIMELKEDKNEEVNPEDLKESNWIPVPERDIRTSYDVLLSENNELLLKIKEHSKDLYKHSILIGDISGKAANAIGANENLAIAGGYYHEVGKIKGKNYIEEGLKLAEEYAFPEELKNILKQHNIKYDKPTSVESAIVMITDNVASTIEYIDKAGNKKFSSASIIDNIFRMRMDKGTFDDSGLSIRNFNLLRDFYHNEFKTKDDEVQKEDTLDN